MAGSPKELVPHNEPTQERRKAVLSILAETLLGMLVPDARCMGGSSRNPLISRSQHALVLTENTVRKRRSQRGRKD